MHQHSQCQGPLTTSPSLDVSHGGVLRVELLVLDGPGQAVVEADVQLWAGEAEAVSAGQVPAVVREVGVARGPHHARHRVQAHPEHTGVRAQRGRGPEDDRARASGRPLELRGLPDQGQQRGAAGGEARGRGRPGHEHQLGQ